MLGEMDVRCCFHSRIIPSKKSDIDFLDKIAKYVCYHIFSTVQTGPDGQPRFPRTVPRSGSCGAVPVVQRSDLHSPNGGVRQVDPNTIPRHFSPTDTQTQMCKEG